MFGQAAEGMKQVCHIGPNEKKIVASADINNTGCSVPDIFSKNRVNECPFLKQARQDHFRLNKIHPSHSWTKQRKLECSRFKVIGLALGGEDSCDLSWD